MGAWSPCSAAPMPDSGCLPHAGIATLDASSVNVVFRCAAGSSKASHRFGVGRCAIRSGISGTCQVLPSFTQPDCLHMVFLLVPDAVVSRNYTSVPDLLVRTSRRQQ